VFPFHIPSFLQTLAQQLCACDRTVAYCMKKNLKSYKVKYRHYSNFLRPETLPQPPPPASSWAASPCL
uniref:Uncharacterized protein n=1 Tax=Vombatus ursinus TaxID=29139 RepID=A0A4X2KZR5_VOMUR